MFKIKYYFNLRNYFIYKNFIIISGKEGSDSIKDPENPIKYITNKDNQSIQKELMNVFIYY